MQVQGLYTGDLCEALYAKYYVQGYLCKTLNAGCYVRVQELCIRYLGTDAVGCYVECCVQGSGYRRCVQCAVLYC